VKFFKELSSSSPVCSYFHFLSLETLKEIIKTSSFRNEDVLTNLMKYSPALIQFLNELDVFLIPE